MALVQCLDCGKQISDKAIACIGCGAPTGTKGADIGLQSAQRIIKTAKSRGVYIILGLFLGCFGIHNFYAGYNGRGVIQLLITLLTGWLVIGLVITVLWALIELITVDVDSAGDQLV
ncbi:TM2 domain-containing protein [Stenotrophomonas rhizophila]|uniref:TM2 domain-containing protein n=1 Tax=Stenotrophomonas rhizophila TaxID=216778 RepID=A0A498CKH4_9GAMM|nr:TM2 domain-containing protein [Stenotrophomonas rhizophila]RLK53420.1 TM2 domain-containing protein [Stenotrophomonas rhizophila]